MDSIFRFLSLQLLARKISISKNLKKNIFIPEKFEKSKSSELLWIYQLIRAANSRPKCSAFRLDCSCADWLVNRKWLPLFIYSF